MQHNAYTIIVFHFLPNPEANFKNQTGKKKNTTIWTLLTFLCCVHPFFLSNLFGFLRPKSPPLALRVDPDGAIFSCSQDLTDAPRIHRQGIHFATFRVDVASGFFDLWERLVMVMMAMMGMTVMDFRCFWKMEVYKSFWKTGD